jgi:hypothetical protein
MDYRLIFSPDIDLDPEAFVETWNDDDSCREQAVAETRESGRAQSPDAAPDAAPDLMMFLANVGAGVAASAIIELVKQVLEKRGITQETRMKHVEHADGRTVLVVETEG